MPVASFKVVVPSFFFGQFGTRFDGGVIDTFKDLVHEAKMFLAFPAYATDGKCMVISADS